VASTDRLLVAGILFGICLAILLLSGALWWRRRRRRRSRSGMHNYFHD